MENSLKALLLFTMFMYSLTVGYYTFYGVSKSYIEYFCKQGRASELDYRYQFRANVLSIGEFGSSPLLTVLGGNFSYLKPSYFSHNDGTSSDKTKKGFQFDSFASNNMFQLDYKVDQNYFQLKCRSYGFTFPKKDLDNNSYVLLKEKVFRVVDDGYIDERFGSLALVDMTGFKSLREFECILTKAPKTCEIKIETTNKFFKYYFVLCSVFCFLFLMLALPCKDRFTLRFYVKIREAVHSICKPERTFCNPITGLPFYLVKGDWLFKLTTSDEDIYLGEGDSDEMTFFEDSKSKSYIVNDSVLYIDDNKRRCFHLGQRKTKILKSYLIEILNDPSLCVVNDEEDHYLSMFDFLVSFERNNLIKVKKQNDGFVLKVREFEFTYLKDKFQIKEKVLKFLLEHNWRFFGGEYNIESLEKSISGKNWSSFKPKGVKNSQWKWYTSDVKTYLAENDVFIKTQVDWRPSEALRGMKWLKPEDLEVEKLPEKLVVSDEIFFEELKETHIKRFFNGVKHNIERAFTPQVKPYVSKLSYAEVLEKVSDKIGDFYAAHNTATRENTSKARCEKMENAKTKLIDIANTFKEVGTLGNVLGCERLYCYVKDGCANGKDIAKYEKIRGSKIIGEKRNIFKTLSSANKSLMSISIECEFYEKRLELMNEYSEKVRKSHEVYVKENKIKKEIDFRGFLLERIKSAAKKKKIKKRKMKNKKVVKREKIKLNESDCKYKSFIKTPDFQKTIEIISQGKGGNNVRSKTYLKIRNIILDKLYSEIDYRLETPADFLSKKYDKLMKTREKNETLQCDAEKEWSRIVKEISDFLDGP